MYVKRRTHSDRVSYLFAHTSYCTAVNDHQVTEPSNWVENGREGKWIQPITLFDLCHCMLLGWLSHSCSAGLRVSAIFFLLLFCSWLILSLCLFPSLPVTSCLRLHSYLPDSPNSDWLSLLSPSSLSPHSPFWIIHSPILKSHWSLPRLLTQGLSSLALPCHALPDLLLPPGSTICYSLLNLIANLAASQFYPIVTTSYALPLLSIMSQ